MRLLPQLSICSFLLLSFTSQLVIAEEHKLRLSGGREIDCGSKNQCIAAKSSYPGSIIIRK